MSFTWAGLIFHICCLTTALCTICCLKHYKPREKSNLSKDGGTEEVSSVCMFFFNYSCDNRKSLLYFCTEIFGRSGCDTVFCYCCVLVSFILLSNLSKGKNSHNQTCALGAFGRGSKG